MDADQANIAFGLSHPLTPTPAALRPRACALDLRSICPVLVGYDWGFFTTAISNFMQSSARIARFHPCPHWVNSDSRELFEREADALRMTNSSGEPPVPDESRERGGLRRMSQVMLSMVD